jgi:multicomponent Na+:H+ antiporter subunit D
MGYAALFDLGCIITVLGVGGPSAVLTVLVYLAVRTLALVLVAIGMSTMNLQAASSGFSQIRGMAYRMPLATIALMLGGFTLAGLPFTAGFAPHWHLFNAMAQLDLRGVILLVLGSFGVAGGYLRGLRAALTPGNAIHTKKEPAFEEPTALLILMIVLCTIIILFGLFPALLIEPLDRFAIVLSFPGR